jgi:hypothetical protein
MNTAAPKISVSRFRCKGICSFIPSVLSEIAVGPSSVSKRQLLWNVNQNQENLPGCHNWGLSATPEEVALTSSTSVDRSIQEIIPSPKTDWERKAFRRFLNLNANLLSKDLFKGKPRERQELDIGKVTKKVLENTYFVRTVMVITSILKKMATGFGVLSAKFSFKIRIVMLRA